MYAPINEKPYDSQINIIASISFYKFIILQKYEQLREGKDMSMDVKDNKFICYKYKYQEILLI